MAPFDNFSPLLFISGFYFMYSTCISFVSSSPLVAAANTTEWGACPVYSESQFSIYRTPSSLSIGREKKRRNVIMLLVPEFGQVLDGMPCVLPCSVVDKDIILHQLDMFDTYFLDSGETDFVIFHEGYPHKREMVAIREATTRNVDFVNVDAVFTRIPEGLDPYDDQPNWTKRGKWRYQQMIRFMAEDVFKFPVMDNVDYFMRIDIDSCFQKPFHNLFSKMNGPGRQAVYLANNQSLEAADQLPGTHLLEKLVKDYVRRNDITPKSPKRWKKTFSKQSVFTYSNNLEISSIEFFRRPEVVKFNAEILNSLGIFKYRWGDAILRYITLTLFAAEDEVLHAKHFDIAYDHPCWERKTHQSNYGDFMQQYGKDIYGL